MDINSIIIAILAFMGVAVTALSTVFGAMLKTLANRVSELEVAKSELRKYNHKLWNWCRSTVTVYEVWRRPGAPDLDPIPES